MMAKYIHIHTGSIDTRDGWIASYATEELDERGITAEQAFDEDEGVTLIEQPPEYKPSTFRIRVDLDRKERRNGEWRTTSTEGAAPAAKHGGQRLPTAVRTAAPLTSRTSSE